MAYNTMYFSRSSSGYNAENGDYIDFNPDSSISFGTLYKCTTFYCSITGGITSATTSARDHDMNLQIQINGSWITIWSGTQYLPKRGTTGYTITFSGSIPSGSQVNAAKYGISDIRLQQDGDYALRGANASGYIDVNYEDNVTSCGAPTSVKINNSTSTVSTTGSSVTLSWSGASGGTNNSISSYRIFYTNSTDGSTWDGWYEYTDYASTSTSGSLTVNLGNAGTYRKFGIATVGSAGDEYGSARVESPIVYRQAISACGAPTSCSLSSTLATGNVTLSWSGASAGTSNSIKGYKIQRCESSNGSSWGNWADLTTVSSTSTSASLTVSPPSTAGNYYKYRVLTMGSAGSSYYSGYKESTNTLRRNWTSCGAPTSVSVSSTNVAPNTSVTLSWSGATSGYGNAISGYQIYRSTRSSGTYTKIADVTSTSASGSYSVSAPSDRNASYYYKVLTVGSVSGFNSGQSSATATLILISF